MDGESQAGLDFDTESEASAFNDWVAGIYGCLLEQEGATLNVPEGVGCGQDTLNKWRDRWEEWLEFV